MSVTGWARCQQCGQMVNALIWWPSAANARNAVCHNCHAKLTAACNQLIKGMLAGDTPDCPYKVASISPTSSPRQTTVKHYLMPAGCEYRFLFMWWMALTGRINEGLLQ